MSSNKTKIFALLISLVPLCSFSQEISVCDGNNYKLITLMKSNYKDLPMDGAKFVSIGNCKYIIGVGTTSTKSKTTSVMARISSVKARREVLLLLNNAFVTSEAILTTEQVITDNTSSYFEGFRDEVTEKSSAFVSGMPMLTAFKSSDGSTFIYILYKLI
tara:strand:+ start:2585 stop:3064 length:480 start_codon:yes stop_codon:yes gene_type:complete